MTRRRLKIAAMQSRAGQARSVVLVAHEPRGTEHLGIRYVAAALQKVGVTANVLPLCSLDQVPSACAEALSAGPPLFVGLSITDALVAPLLLTFARGLRRAGYKGHVTAGGPLATLLRKKLLAEQPALDSVIRHDGERAAQALACALAENTPLAHVPGLSTRSGDGRPNPRLAWSTAARPLRSPERPRVLGLACAEVAASRGCAGRCTYCGVAALERDARAELAQVSCPAEEARLGLGARRRSADDVAAEVAELQRHHAVRVVRLVDDNLLGADAGQALRWLHELRTSFDARGVRPLALRMMVEARVVSDEVAAALAELGVVQVLLGVESLTAQGLRALGRPGTPAENLNALYRLARFGIAAQLNVLALRPGGSLADARAEIAALAELDAFAWDVLPVVVNPGTDLALDLAARGELAGQGLGISWRPRNRPMERALYAVERLRAGGLAWRAQETSLPDLDFALRAGLRCGVPGVSTDLLDGTRALLCRAQQERRRTLGLALELAESDLGDAELGQAVETFLVDLRARLRPVHAQADALLSSAVPRSAAQALTRSDFLRPASPFLAAALFVALAADCGRGGLHASSPPDSAADIAADAQTPSHEDHAGPTTSSPDAATSNPEVTASDGSNAPSGSDTVCDTDKLWQAVSENRVGGDYCEPVQPPEQGYWGTVFLDSTGRVVNISDQLGNSVAQDWLDSVANDRWPCLAGQSIRYTCYVHLY